MEAAEDWGTCVMVHAYTDRAVSRAVEAGVKVIEHGQLATEETAKEMAENGVWLSTQAWAAASPTAGELMKAEGPITHGKWETVNEGFEAASRPDRTAARRTGHRRISCWRMGMESIRSYSSSMGTTSSACRFTPPSFPTSRSAKASSVTP